MTKRGEIVRHEWEECSLTATFALDRRHNRCSP